MYSAYVCARSAGEIVAAESYTLRPIAGDVVYKKNPFFFSVDHGARDDSCTYGPDLGKGGGSRGFISGRIIFAGVL